MLLTVITPCYNSTKTLHRTYESLLAQSHGDIEWILVDDCSTDNGATRRLIKQLATEAPFPVKVHFLEKNYFAAKSAATGCLLADGKFACILDHDDQFVFDTLVKVNGYLERYAVRNDIAGVCGRCINDKGEMIGHRFKFDEQVVTEGEIRFKQRITSELFQFTRVELMKQWFEKMKPGYTNGFVWAKISEKYKYVFVNDILRIYDTELPTSYSNSASAPVKFPEAKAEALLSTLDSYSGYLIYNPIFSLRLSASLVRHRLNFGSPYVFNLSENNMVNLFILASFPFGLFKKIGLL